METFEVFEFESKIKYWPTSGGDLRFYFVKKDMGVFVAGNLDGSHLDVSEIGSSNNMLKELEERIKNFPSDNLGIILHE